MVFEQRVDGGVEVRYAAKVQLLGAVDRPRHGFPWPGAVSGPRGAWR
jgi:hypothetical protein